MPELPEVETVCRYLREHISGEEIKKATVNRYELRKGTRIPYNFISRIEGQVIDTVKRRGKYILIHLRGKDVIVGHLGMTGKLLVQESTQAIDKHSHVILDFVSGKKLVFSDPRRFGLILLVEENEVKELPFFKNMGIEPLGEEFSGEYLKEKLNKTRIPIKTELLDQSIVAGLGNIYVCEALFICGISPLRPAKEISISQARILVSTIKELLQRAISAGGTTFRDYRGSDGKKGAYISQLLVYGREGERCEECNWKKVCEGIKKISLNGRATYYCPRKQV